MTSPKEDNWRDVYLSQIKEIEERRKYCSEDQYRFTMLMKKVLENGGTISPKQLDALDDIWMEVVL